MIEGNTVRIVRKAETWSDWHSALAMLSNALVNLRQSEAKLVSCYLKNHFNSYTKANETHVVMYFGPFPTKDSAELFNLEYAGDRDRVPLS